MPPHSITLFTADSRDSHTIHQPRGITLLPMLRRLRQLIGWVMLLLTLLFVVYPFGETSWLLLTDRGLRGAGPSTYAYNLHAALSAELPGYVDRRIKSGVAETLNVHQITA